jgi:hypothetical protein
MSTPGRNDPCPCGSGKKYKKCHGAVVILPLDLKYERIRRLETEASSLLLTFAKEHFGPDALAEAWEDFIFPQDTELAPDGPETDFFTRWFPFSWRPDAQATLPELYLSEKASAVDSAIRGFLEAVIRAPYSFFQTVDAESGSSLRLRDILRKKDFQVTEHAASKLMGKGDLLYARVVELDGLAFLLGNGSRIIPATYFETLLDFRIALEKAGLLTRRGDRDSTLLELEDQLRELYFNIQERTEHQKIKFRNTEGDPLELHTMTYSVPSFEGAFEALKDLELRITKGSDRDLLEGEGEAVIQWLKAPKKGGVDVISVATLKITGSTLVVEANSAKRAKRIQKEIAKRLGGEAVLMRSEVVPTEGLLKKSVEAPPEEATESEHDRLMRESPEARSLLKRLTDQHWASWPDIPLPALKGMTPRQAARDTIGRELLESLLLDFESRNRNLKDEFTQIDVPKLRQELGLTLFRILYRHGMVQNIRNLKGLRKLVLEGDRIPPEVLAAIEENHLEDAGGTYGDPETGRPIEYDHLIIERPQGRTEITFYNRGISLLSGDDETELRIHRVCAILQRLMSE